MAATPDSPVKSAGEAKGRSSRADVLQFLDSLDSFTPSDSPAPSLTTPVVAQSNTEDAQSVLDFLDEITQRSQTPTSAIQKRGTPTPLTGLSRSSSRTNVLSAPSRNSTESIRSNKQSVNSPISTTPLELLPAPTPIQPIQSTSEQGWGWGSVWNSAATIVQQARTVAEEQVKTATQTASEVSGNFNGLGEGLMKALGDNEQAKKLAEGVREFARSNQLDQLGKDLRSQTLKSLTELLNAVAPPIAEHEVIKVNLSHDMIGYDGVETLVYRGLAKIMDQIEGGTLIVNKGDEEKPKEDAGANADSDERNLNYVEGLAQGWKLAEANLEQLIKNSFLPSASTKKENNSSRGESIAVPITTCPIFMRIQPCLAPLPYCVSLPSDAEKDPSASESTMALFFLLLLRDPTHNLIHSSLSQSIPASWLEIPFEENEWVEDVMVDVIRRGVEVIGQEYISHRMRAQGEAISKARGAAQDALSSQIGVTDPVSVIVDDEQERLSAEAVAMTRAV